MVVEDRKEPKVAGSKRDLRKRIPRRNQTVSHPLINHRQFYLMINRYHSTSRRKEKEAIVW
jgi:hypothetical protein